MTREPSSRIDSSSGSELDFDHAVDTTLRVRFNSGGSALGSPRVIQCLPSHGLDAIPTPHRPEEWLSPRKTGRAVSVQKAYASVVRYETSEKDLRWLVLSMPRDRTNFSLDKTSMKWVDTMLSYEEQEAPKDAIMSAYLCAHPIKGYVKICPARRIWLYLNFYLSRQTVDLLRDSNALGDPEAEGAARWMSIDHGTKLIGVRTLHDATHIWIPVP